MSESSRLTRKCQVTVPKGIRRALRLKAGDTVHFSIEEGVATAIHQRADAFVTNDAGLRRIREIRVTIPRAAG